MGLMLSILVVCVGVIEALSCYEHFQYGVIRYATNSHESARRRSSLFLKYTSGRLKLLPEHSVAQYDEDSREIFQPIRFKRQSVNGLEKHQEDSAQTSDHFKSVKKSKTIYSSTERVKKLDKEEKMHIVKSLLEKPRKPNVVRSISMPEMIYTERDIELTNIINNLAIEPIEEINIEIEDVNPEVLTEEFDNLFDEYESFSSNVLVDSSLNNLKEPVSQNTNKLNYVQKAEVRDLKVYGSTKESLITKVFENSQKDTKLDLISDAEIKRPPSEIMGSSPASFEEVISEKGLPQKREKNYQIARSVDFVEVPSIRFNKSLTENLDISSYFNKKSNVSSKSDSLLEGLLIVDESISYNKLDDTIFDCDTPSLEVIDTTFEEIYNNIWDESLDLTRTYEEIEKNVLSKDDDFGSNLKAKSSEKSRHMSCATNAELDLSKGKTSLTNATFCGKTILKDTVVKAVEQLAELIVKDALNLNKIKSLIFQKLTHLNTFNSNEKLDFNEVGKQAFDISKRNQSEKNTTVEEALDKSKYNVRIEKMKNFNESKNSEEINVSQKLSKDKCVKDSQTKIFPAAAKNDLTYVRHEVDGNEVQIIDSSILVKENSNLFLNEGEGEGNEGKDTKAETIKDFLESENNEFESGTKSLSYDSKESGIEQKIFKTEFPFVEAGNNTDNETRDRKLEDLLIKREQKNESEWVSGGLEKKTEIQSENDVTTIYKNSDLLSETTKTCTTKGKTLLAPRCKEEIKSEEKKKEITSTEQRVEQDIGNKNSEEVQPVDVMGKLKLPKEAEESIECERVSTIGSKFAKDYHADILKEVNPDNRVNLCSENKDEFPGASDGGTEVKSANSAPEAFWLIFSGEYTKAMSKDWHSGHFSCWQCDEALTGQRYVLRDDHPYCIKCYETVFANVCEECNKIIGIDSKDLSYKDKHWHEACFLCNKCRVSLVDKQFGSKADKIYCGNCYDAQFASRCDGCGEIFRAGTKKMEYKTRQWHEKCFCCCVCKTPIGTKSFIPREQEIYCATCYEEKFATRCVKCNKIITSGGVTYKNEPWHRECFTCTNCNTSLAGQRFTSRDEKPYCADCFGELFAKRCTACSKPITGIGGTRFISFEDRHWHNDCFICASCKTSLVGRGFITDGDDIICPECAKQKLM